MYTIHSRATDDRSAAAIWMGKSFKGSDVEKDLNRRALKERVVALKKARPIFGKRA